MVPRAGRPEGHLGSARLGSMDYCEACLTTASTEQGVHNRRILAGGACGAAEVSLEGLADVGNVVRMQATSKTTEITAPDHINSRVLMSRGKSIGDFADPVKFLPVMRDAVRGHCSMPIGGHIPSATSAQTYYSMIAIPSYPRANCFHVFLIGFN